MTAGPVALVCGAGIVSGKELMVLALAKGLRSRGRDVVVLTSTWSNGDMGKRLAAEGIAFEALPLGFISATMTWPNLRMTAEQLWRWPALHFGYNAFLKRVRPARVVHTNWHHMLVLAPLLRPSDLFWIHDFIPATPRYRRLFQWFAKRIEAFVCVSNSVADSLRGVGIVEASLKVVHNGIDDLAGPEVPSAGAGERFRIGIVGQVGAWKGHEDLLMAFAHVRTQVRNAELHVFGTGSVPYGEFLRARATELAIADAVTWHGYVSDRLRIYPNLDICVVPSRSEDPLPTIALESGLFRIPVVATRRGGLPEAIRHEETGLLVDAEAPDQLAAAIERLAGDPVLRQSLGIRARAHVLENFPATRFLDRFDAILDTGEGTVLSQVTPVLLTFNEIANIEHTLAKLSWASQIVVVDSCSTDGTIEAARANKRVTLFEKPFESHAVQWNYAIEETGISTEWVLALDADHVLTDEFVAELQALAPKEDVAGYWVSFQYCVGGKPLRGSVYPPVLSLYRRRLAHYRQDGHTQRVHVNGATELLAAPIRHDDRKSFARWLAAQDRYMRLEAAKLASTPFAGLPLSDKIRKMIVLAPAAVFLYALFARGAIRDGLPGMHYALQRALAEVILSLHLVKRLLGAR